MSGDNPKESPVHGWRSAETDEMKNRRGRLSAFIFRIIFNMTCLITVVSAAAGQATKPEPTALPVPTGPFGIGRVTVHWTDGSRLEELATDHRNRELMLDIWYPAETHDGPRAQYLDAVALERLSGPNGLSEPLGRR